jgi:cell division protein FtsX
MEWANKRFGNSLSNKPSRVVIKTKDPGNPELVKYLQNHGLTADADKTRFSKYRQIVNAIVGVSWVTGAVMLLFALLIFTLFIQLTIASCKTEIQLLITLGASPKQLQRFLMQQFFPFNLIVTSIVLIIIAGLQFLLFHFLQQQHIFLQPYLSLSTVASAIVVVLVLWWVNRTTIKKYIRLQQ